MTDASFDAEKLDPMDTEAVYGGGGYVDDDIDLDDDDDDEPLIVSPSKPVVSAVPHSIKRRAKPLIIPPSPAKKPRVRTAHPNDFQLRAAGTGAAKDYVIANFLSRMPDLTDSPHVRMYRENEMTLDTRNQGLEAHKKQLAYYGSFSGKRKLERYKKLGIETVPDRKRKGWTLEVAPHSIAEKVATGRKADMVKKAQAQPGTPGDSSSALAPDDAATAANTPVWDSYVDTFRGVFDGKTVNCGYAIMVMNKGTKVVDVVPVGDFSWFAFRPNHVGGVDKMDEADAPKPKKKKTELTRMEKYQARYFMSQAKREHDLGDDTRLQMGAEDFARVGIRRSGKPQESVEEVGEADGLDFDEEFDNDDVAQVDKESIQKPVTRVQGDAEQLAKNFRQMIKDEPESLRPRSPGSDSEEEAGASGKNRSATPSPSRPSSATRSPNKVSKSRPPTGQRMATPLGASPSSASPSPGRSSRGSTPKKVDLGYLLPPAGVLPTSDHLSAVLSVLLKGKQRITFKEYCSYFDCGSKAKKDNLVMQTKKIAIVTADPKKPKRHYISWKTAPSGSSSR